MNFITFLKAHRAIVFVLESVVISAIVLLSVCQFSCKVDENGISVLNGDYTSPTLNSYAVKNASEVDFSFSRSVSLNDVTVSPDIGRAMVFSLESISGGDYAVTFQNKMKIGEEYSIYGIAVDSSGNSLTFCVPVQGYNDNVPSLEITEAQIKYSSGNGNPICEYVELRALSNGNIAGVEIFSATDGSVMLFPPIEVKTGDIIIAHLRNAGSGAVSELQDNITLSTAETSSNKARDIWSENTKARLNDTADVILLKNSADGTILDALLYAKDGTENWKNDALKDAADSAVKSGVWKPNSNSASAVDITGASYAKSITRISPAHNAASWTIQQRSAGEVYGENSSLPSTSTSLPTTPNVSNNEKEPTDNEEANKNNGNTASTSPDPAEPNTPSIEITEAQIKYNNDKKNDTYSCEFVELRALENVNLLGLEIFSASDGYSKSFFLPDIEMKKDESIIVHLRSAGEGCISELDDNLNLSPATYSADGIRDIWSGNKDGSRLNDNADILLLRNSSTGTIVDALLYAKSTYENWQQTVEPTAEILSNSLWQPNASVSSAVTSDDTTYEKSLQRISHAKKASSWIVAAPTPGVVEY